eukprot:9309257-Lingulodinium_polyedra.AAC.1
MGGRKRTRWARSTRSFVTDGLGDPGLDGAEEPRHLDERRGLVAVLARKRRAAHRAAAHGSVLPVPGRTVLETVSVGRRARL